MFRKCLSILFNDVRRGDDRSAPLLAETGKPPVLRRSTLNSLGMTLLVVILYGSLMPFQLQDGLSWTWHLPLHKPSPPDFVANLILYFPVGVFLRLFYRRRGTHAVTEIAMSLITILAVSYGTEVCQTLLVDRVASLTDVVSNVAGAAAGILLAPIAQRGMRNLHGWLFTALRWNPFTATAAMLTLAISMFALLPFDPLPTRSHIGSRLEAVMNAESLLPFGGGRGGDLTVSLEDAVTKVLAVLAYGVLAFVMVLAEYEKGRRSARSTLYAFTLVSAFAAAIELVQLSTISHAFDPADLTGAWICAGLGTLTAFGWAALRTDLTLHHRMLVIKVLTLAALFVSILWAIVPSFNVEQPGTSSFRVGLPMLSSFHMSWNALMGSYVVAFMRYALIAGVVVVWRRSNGRVPREWMILASAIGALLLMSTLTWWSNQPIDSCHLLLAGLAAVLVHRADLALFSNPSQPLPGTISTA